MPASGKIFTSSTSMRVMKSTGTRSSRRAQTSTRSLLSLPRSSTLRRQTRWWWSKTSPFSRTAALICKLTSQHRPGGGSSCSLSPSVKPQVLPPYAANAHSVHICICDGGKFVTVRSAMKRERSQVEMLTQCSERRTFTRCCAFCAKTLGCRAGRQGCRQCLRREHAVLLL